LAQSWLKGKGPEGLDWGYEIEDRQRGPLVTYLRAQ